MCGSGYGLLKYRIGRSGILFILHHLWLIRALLCPIVISLSVRPSEMKFSGGVSILSLKGTWNFSFGFPAQGKIHIEFAFRCGDLLGSGVICPWIFYYRTFACNSFPFFSTLSHNRTCNFPWGFSEVSFISSSRFIMVTTFGSRVICPWISYFRTYACNSFPMLFSTPSHIKTWNSNFIWFFWGKLHIEFTSCCGDNLFIHIQSILY
jgi:hypothetical protein